MKPSKASLMNSIWTVIADLSSTDPHTGERIEPTHGGTPVVEETVGSRDVHSQSSCKRVIIKGLEPDRPGGPAWRKCTPGEFEEGQWLKVRGV
jgi:hypothetical protein